ncbi:glycosyltransferase family 2 protein [Chromobacterium haemolyticum]|uniref:glycosyltransferase family 2 protein n=1 Tax=Chromobacterium haemolyticum TaxID=394935 RepID=UPI00405543D4
MSFRPCLIIPCYNHGSTMGGVLERLRPYGVPAWVVDDGSDEATRLTLEALARAEPWVRLLRLPRNGGKGAAVTHAMRLAYQEGYSHALQVDADGQHALSDVPRFLERAAQRPDAVIAGRPLYDASVPKARLYGRCLTHFWVWVETLSFDIADSMCGFRCYPLAATEALLRRTRIPRRMDFDIEIIVRLHWAGAPVLNLPTRVTYPPGGLSHFDALRDNARISLMHTRLALGMLPRAPRLLRRRWREARA